MKDSITAKALAFAEKHVGACEDWSHGQAKGSWINEKGDICIQYEDGCWWYYRETDGCLVWY